MSSFHQDTGVDVVIRWHYSERLHITMSAEEEAPYRLSRYNEE